MRQDRISDALLPSTGTTAPRLGHALLWTPSYVGDDKILWHVPFLFWLLEATRPRRYVEIGVGQGVAYMAVCQALHRMRAHAQCFAVGQSDENEGASERLIQRNADLYDDFSQILTGGPDAAAGVIDDASVDLMLVDLMEAPDVAASIEAAWLPKLSSKGILLLNGTAGGAAGTAELMESLSSKSPTIQLPGGDGLMVVLPRGGLDDELANIAALTPDDPAHKLIVQMFTRLGAGAYHEVHARAGADRAGALGDEIGRLTQERDELASRLEERDREYDARHRKTAILQSHVFDLQVAADAARSEVKRLEGDLAVATSEREESYEMLRQDRAAHRDTRERADKAAAEVDQLRKELEVSAEQAAAERDRLAGELAALKANSEQAHAERERLAGEIAGERTKFAELSALLEAERQDRRQIERQRDQALAEAERLGARVTELSQVASEHYRTVRDLVSALAENENLVAALTEELRTQRQDSEALVTAMAIEAKEAERAKLAAVPPSGLLDRLTGRSRK